VTDAPNLSIVALVLFEAVLYGMAPVLLVKLIMRVVRRG